MFFKSTGKNKSRSDSLLIKQYKATGDLDVLGELFEKYMHLVYGVCLKYLRDRDTSKDATMQIFEKLMVELPKRQVENFKPWLHVITKNHCLMQIRVKKSKTVQQEKMLENQDFFMESSYELHHNNESIVDRNLETLKKCIDELKAEQKECVKLFYLEEKCYQEIANSLNIEIKKVKSHIQNGKRNLKICMDRHG